MSMHVDRPSLALAAGRVDKEQQKRECLGRLAKERTCTVVQPPSDGSDNDDEPPTPRKFWNMTSEFKDNVRPSSREEGGETAATPQEQRGRYHQPGQIHQPGPINDPQAFQPAERRPFALKRNSPKSKPSKWCRDRTPSPDNYLHPMLNHDGNQKPASKQDDLTPRGSQCGQCNTDDGPATPRGQGAFAQDAIPPAEQAQQDEAHSQSGQKPAIQSAPATSFSESQIKRQPTQDSNPIADFESQFKRPSEPVRGPKTVISIADFASLLPPPAKPPAASPALAPKTISIAAFVGATQHDQQKCPGPTQKMSFPSSSNRAANKHGIAAMSATLCQPSVQVSLGSVGHPNGCKEACKYAAKTRGCKDGAQCVRCHLCKWNRYTTKTV